MFHKNHFLRTYYFNAFIIINFCWEINERHMETMIFTFENWRCPHSTNTHDLIDIAIPSLIKICKSLDLDMDCSSYEKNVVFSVTCIYVCVCESIIISEIVHSTYVIVSYIRLIKCNYSLCSHMPLQHIYDCKHKYCFWNKRTKRSNTFLKSKNWKR